MVDLLKKRGNVTPKGALNWIYIKKTRPDTDEYSVSINLTAKEAKELVAQHEATLKANGLAGPKVVKLKLKQATDIKRNESGKGLKDEDGNYIKIDIPNTYQFTFKQYATAKDGTPRRVTVVDAKGRPIPHDKVPNIDKGTIGKVSFSICVYESKMKSGIALYLDAIQIIELKEFTGDGLGFGVEEGYESDFEDSSPFDGGKGKPEPAKLDDEIPF